MIYNMKYLIFTIVLFSSCVKKQNYICTKTTKTTLYKNSSSPEIYFDTESYSRMMTKKEKSKYEKDNLKYTPSYNQNNELVNTVEVSVNCQ